MYQRLKRYESVCRICFEKRTLGHLFVTWFIFDDVLCVKCRDKMKGEFIEIERLEMVMSTIYPYKGFSRDQLLKFKDNHDRWLCDVFFSPFLIPFYLKFYNHTVVFVPSHKSQLEKRGYIPNLELIKCLYLPHLEDVFNKKHPYKQSTMHRDVRSNVASVIELKDIKSIKGKNILLFDDLVTTGNSLKACYDLLKPHVKSLKVFALFHHEI